MALFNRSMLPRDAVEAEQFAIDRGLIVKTRVCNRHRNKTPTIRDSSSDNGFFGMYQCNPCGGRKKSVADGSWFENARLEPRKIFDVMYSFCKEDTYDGVTQETAREDDPTKLSRSTIAYWYRYCRDMAVEIIADKQLDEGQLGGEGVVVQIDESKFGVRKFHKGRRVEGHWVLGITESKLGEDDTDARFRMVMLPNNKRDKSTLESVIVQHVAPGSTIWTDAWRGYLGLPGHGYGHEFVNHSDQHGFNWCPKIKFLKTKNYPALLKYCEINGDSVEELELITKRKTSNEVLVAILKLCPNVKRLTIVAAKGQSISWVSDVLKSHIYSLESVTISYNELTSQMFDDIQLIGKLSGSLAQVNLEISGRSVTESHEVALHAQLYNQLPQLNSTRFRTEIKDIETLGPYITSLTVVIMQPNFSFEFLKSFKKLVSLRIGAPQEVMTLETLVETLPDSVRTFVTTSGNDVQFERLTNLLRHRGAQLEHLEIRLAPSSSGSDAEQFLLEVGINCPNIRVLKFENHKFANVFDLTLDCTEQFEAMVSKVKRVEHIEMKGIFVRQEAIAKALAECKHLVHIDVQILETTFDPVELYNMLYKSAKLYRAKLTSVRMDGTLSNKGVYHYVNGMHYNELPTLNENPLLPLDV
ncbi:hypothetical protein HDE_00971 [Halotydeus destructor]|nr:hypothetical protein HDE_00971 [Halotydeus destructor]